MIIFQAGGPIDVTLVKDTCTVPGRYAFSLQHCVDRDRYSHVAIVKDGSIVMAGVAHGETWYPCAGVRAAAGRRASLDTSHIWELSA